MAYRNIEVRPLSPVIGAEVHGVDLTKPLGNDLFDEVSKALMTHQVIFFRDQPMTLDQHKAFARRFGDLHIHPSAPGPEGHPEVIAIRSDADTKRIAGQYWHTDVSCDEEPPMGSILHLHEVPSPGGDTMFASMYAAYDTLSDTMKDMLSGLRAWHESEHVHKARFDRFGKERETGGRYPTALQPVVRTHPVTGRKGLYVNRTFTTRIDGMRKEESDALLEMLFTHIERPEFHCRFAWQPHSVAFWDNRCTQHLALWDYYPRIRSGFRVTVKGDRPF
jgi:taurine dioxygenase